MAKYFESLVRKDPFFEIPAKRHLGLVVFRLKVMSFSVAMNDAIWWSLSMLETVNAGLLGMLTGDVVQISFLFILQIGS